MVISWTSLLNRLDTLNNLSSIMMIDTTQIFCRRIRAKLTVRLQSTRSCETLSISAHLQTKWTPMCWNASDCFLHFHFQCHAYSLVTIAGWTTFKLSLSCDMLIKRSEKLKRKGLMNKWRVSVKCMCVRVRAVRTPERDQSKNMHEQINCDDVCEYVDLCESDDKLSTIVRQTLSRS